jgi:ubiquinone/menaquinone biosynthesis C-methylase UbiE
MPGTSPSPEKVIQHSMMAHATAAAVGAAVTHALFTHIEEGADTPDALAERAGLSRRGTLALLDALTCIGLLRVADGSYRNSEEASFYLVHGKPAYLGAHAQMVFAPFGQAFRQLPDVVRSGEPNFPLASDPDDTMFWEDLVLAIAPLGRPVAKIVASRLGFEKLHAPSVLDVGGGSGIYAVVLLRANPTATVTQNDWPKVNGIAREFVGRFGLGDRFTTMDGDFHTTDFGSAAYDAIVYSNIAHQESPGENVAMFRKFRRALKSGGSLVVSDFVLNDDRTGNAWTGLFHTFMLLQTRAGAVWRKADYQAWLREAGFSNVVVDETPTPATLIFAS